MAAIREDLHKLIDTTKDEKLLEDIFMILTGRKEYEEGNLWKSLSSAQQQQILASESETDAPGNWISNEEMKKQNQKWLK